MLLKLAIVVLYQRRTLYFVQPKVYNLEEHRISPDKIDQHAFYVIEKLRQAGYTAYLVGGGVRDLLLNRRPKDFDISTSAKPEEIRQLFRNAILIGRRFRLAHIRFGNKIIEVATFRSGDPESNSLIIRDNEWGTEEEDVMRRDFTINGLFYDPKTETVIDYVGGFEDVEKKMLRAIGQPEARFVQDPVRMIRLLKFCARFDLKIDPPTHEALIKCKDHIIQSSPARLLEELLRMLESGSAEPFFKLLYQYGLLKLLIAPLSYFIQLDQDQRIFKFLKELDAQTRKVYPITADRSLPLAIFCFPIFDLTIHHLMREMQKPPHLGIIAQEADRLIGNLFSPFFSIPRRLRGMTASILTSQYRFTPLDGRPIRKPRLPRDETVGLALELLKLRANLNPELQSSHTLWSEAAFHSHTGNVPSEPGQRRPRGRRESSS